MVNTFKINLRIYKNYKHKILWIFEQNLSMYCEEFHVTKRWILGFNPRFKDFKKDLRSK